MATISDLIEQFIKSLMGESDTINISRNELAQYFDCAPSQINYVLATRFSFEHGFVIESRRGGGGFAVRPPRLAGSGSAARSAPDGTG